MAFTATWEEGRAAEIIAAHQGVEGATLPIFHALQAAFGFIPDPAIQMVADALNLSRAEVYGVLTFYHDFRRDAPGKHVLKLCRAEACQAMGADGLADDLRQRLKVEWGGTTADGAMTVEPVFCLGLCACAPAAMIDGRVVGRLNKKRLEALVGEARS